MITTFITTKTSPIHHDRHYVTGGSIPPELESVLQARWTAGEFRKMYSNLVEQQPGYCSKLLPKAGTKWGQSPESIRVVDLRRPTVLSSYRPRHDRNVLGSPESLESLGPITGPPIPDARVGFQQADITSAAAANRAFSSPWAADVARSPPHHFPHGSYHSPRGRYQLDLQHGPIVCPCSERVGCSPQPRDVLVTSKTLPQQSGRPFVVTYPNAPILYGDLYTSLLTLSEYSFKPVKAPPASMLLLSTLIDWYCLFLDDCDLPLIKYLLPEPKGDLRQLSAPVFDITRHLVATNKPISLPPEKDELGYEGLLSTKEGDVLELIDWNKYVALRNKSATVAPFRSSVDLGIQIQDSLKTIDNHLTA
ncbi:hypothetical protein MKZ38_007580 [Zalerion maritima]|uniref:Uncharacterized protein n=1 Tax=Zalerion maritima TaxID=339359 RepID=A0AAD5WTL0_9PEZI|nr:hypothetical protein MKZ38_007580 [Zalerion maritima]